MTVRYRRLNTEYAQTHPHRYMGDEVERVHLEACHAVWVGHTGDEFWDEWVQA